MSRALRGIGWTAAGVAVVAMHGGVAWAVLRHTPPEPLAPSDAVIVELLPAEPTPAPAFTVPDSPLPELASIPEPEPEPLPEPEPQPEPEPEPEPEPVETVEAAPGFTLPDLPTLPTVIPDALQVPSPVAAVRPTSRPERLKTVEPPVQTAKTKAEPKKREPRREAKTAAPQREASPQRAAQPAASNSAGAPRVSQKQVASWDRQIAQRIASHMRRARYSGRPGTVSMRFAIDGSGRVVDVALTGSSGDPGVDSALIRQARRVPTLPPPPSRATVVRILPVGFTS